MRLLSRAIGRPRLPQRPLSVASAASRRHLTNNGFFRVSDEVREALNSKKPVVALETTIYTHGFPYPENVALASLLESIVRVNGGVPATIGVLDGVACVGMSPEELIRLTESAGRETTLKLSRRDLSYVCGLRLAGKKFNGGTTIAGTMLLSQLAGIKVFGTGGLGGVHRGAESSMDISADLTELGRTPVAVVSSGCKSFLDIPRTLEYLETEGVGVGTFADGRTGNVDYPAFWSRDSGVKSPTTITNEAEAAAIIHAQSSLQISSGLLFANPIPKEAEIPKERMEVVIKEAIRQANASGASGKDNTPFILAKIKELTNGDSIPANRKLIESNIRRATIVARELAILEAKQNDVQGANSPLYFNHVQISPVPTSDEHLENASLSPSKPPSTLAPVISPADIVVAGALAVDFSCNYAPLSTSPNKRDPSPHTSNPAVINQSLGGVAHNIAKAAHLLGSSVRLHSAVGDDFTGRAAVSQLQNEGMRVDGVEVLPSPARTAQYVAVNNAEKDLALAMADMSILESISRTTIKENYKELITAASSHPRLVVVDGNWDSESLNQWFQLGKQTGATTVFEPVSTAKSTRIFLPKDSPHFDPDVVFPNPIAHIATPNELELTALHDHAHSTGLFDQHSWFRVIDALGIPSTGLRVPLSVTTTSNLVDRGIPQQAIKLLPFVPTLLTKLGPEGVLLTQIIRADDPIMTSADESRYILARNKTADGEIGGLYVRLYPTERVLPPEEVVSVNGIGDTFLGALASELVKGKRVQDVISFAQKAAVLTLKSKESVSPDLKQMRKL